MFNLCAMVGCCSHVWLFGTTWTVAHQASLSMGFSKQGYWSGLLCLPPGDHPNPRITPSSLSLLHWQEDSLPLSVPGKPYLTYQFSSVQSSLTPGVYSNSCPSSRWCHPAMSSSLSSPTPALNLSQHQGLFQWVNSSNEVAKVLEFQLQHQSFHWTPRTDLF